MVGNGGLRLLFFAPPACFDVTSTRPRRDLDATSTRPRRDPRAWDEFHFNNTLLGPVPEEGVSRLVTQQVSEHRDHFVRYGLAFMIEHGFMKTPKVRRAHERNSAVFFTSSFLTSFLTSVRRRRVDRACETKFRRRVPARAFGSIGP
ncbi:MAG: hypothetical protein CMI16_06790 [Opitutaceae bacterium]|nr:hypothetical protein [Opitutaceae bacterium]